MKILVVGDHKTGKTSVIERFVSGRIPDKHKPTMGVEFKHKTVHISGNVFIIRFYKMIF